MQQQRNSIRLIIKIIIDKNFTRRKINGKKYPTYLSIIIILCHPSIMGNIPLSNNIPEGRRHQDVDDDDDGGTVIYGTSSTQQVDGVLTLKPITNKIKNNNNINIKINNIRYPFDPCKNNNGGSGGVPSSTASILSSSRASISSTKTSSATISCLGKSMFLLPTKTKKSTKSKCNDDDPNKNIKSELMKFILKEDWQRVLIRSRLYPNEIHELSIVYVPILIDTTSSTSMAVNNNNNNNNNNKSIKPNNTDIKYHRMRLLPLHAACSLQPPPEVVRALMIHRIIKTIPSSSSSSSSRKNNVVEKQSTTKMTPLYDNDNTSPAAVSVEVCDRHHHRHRERGGAGFLRARGDAGRDMDKVKKKTTSGTTSFFNKFIRSDRNRDLTTTTTTTTMEDDENCGRDDGNDDEYSVVAYDTDDDVYHNEYEFEHGHEYDEDIATKDRKEDDAEDEDVAFLKKMEEHLARNGRGQQHQRSSTSKSLNITKLTGSIIRDDGSNSGYGRSKKSSSSIFFDFDPSALIPPPSTVFSTEKRLHQQHDHHKHDYDNYDDRGGGGGGYDEYDGLDCLVSLENSIGDDNMDTTTATSILGKQQQQQQQCFGGVRDNNDYDYEDEYYFSLTDDDKSKATTSSSTSTCSKKSRTYSSDGADSVFRLNTNNNNDINNNNNNNTSNDVSSCSSSPLLLQSRRNHNDDTIVSSSSALPFSSSLSQILTSSSSASSSSSLSSKYNCHNNGIDDGDAGRGDVKILSNIETADAFLDDVNFNIKNKDNRNEGNNNIKNNCNIILQLTVTGDIEPMSVLNVDMIDQPRRRQSVVGSGGGDSGCNSHHDDGDYYDGNYLQDDEFTSCENIKTSATRTTDRSSPSSSSTSSSSNAIKEEDNHAVVNITDIELNRNSLVHSLPYYEQKQQQKHHQRGRRRKRNGDNINSNNDNNNNKDDGDRRLLPIHIACLYRASIPVLKILLEEYPEGATKTYVLGMLPIHMVAANWTMVVDNHGSHRGFYGGSGSGDGKRGQQDRVDYNDDDPGNSNEFQRDVLDILLDYSPESLFAKSRAHGLRPSQYVRIFHDSTIKIQRDHDYDPISVDVVVHDKNVGTKKIKKTKSSLSSQHGDKVILLEHLETKEKYHGHNHKHKHELQHKTKNLPIQFRSTKASSSSKFPSTFQSTFPSSSSSSKGEHDDNNDDRTHSSSTCSTESSTIFLHNGVGSTMTASGTKTTRRTAASSLSSSSSSIIRRQPLPSSIVVPPAVLYFVDLLKHGQWDEAFSRLESDPSLSKGWHYSIVDNKNNINNNSINDRHYKILDSFTYQSCGRVAGDVHGSSTSLSSYSILKRLPIHVVCDHYNTNGNKNDNSTTSINKNNNDVVPIGLIQLLISSYPDGLKQPDSLTGSLPLHMICDSFRLDHRSNGNGNDNSGNNGIIIGNTDSRSRRRDYIVSRLQVLQLLLTSYPFATKASDIYGRVPLHRALMANAPFEAIRLLVYRDPRVIACPCWDGVTPFAYAKKIYPIDSPVMHLLKLAWI